MRRLAVLLLALALGLGAGPAGQAQPPGHVWRVAVLGVGSERSAPFYQALEQRLRELGYVEGRNLAIDFRTAEGKLERLPELAAELVGRRPPHLLHLVDSGRARREECDPDYPHRHGCRGRPDGVAIPAAVRMRADDLIH